MKKVLMGALAIFASLALFSCGGNDDDDEVVVTPSSKIINIDIKDATENVTIAKETLADGYRVTFSYDSSTFTETTEGFKAKIVFADGAEGVNFVEGDDVALVVGNEAFVAVEGEANTYWVEFDFAPNGAEMPVTFKKEGALDTVVTIKFVDTNPDVPTVADPVVASPAAGEVAAGTPVVITCATENAMIGYWFGDGSIEESELYDAEHPFVLTESGVLHVQAVLFDAESNPVAFSQVVTVEYTVAAAARVQSVPYAETASGVIQYKARLRFYADMVEGSNAHDAAVYWVYVAEGEESPLTAENYATVATKYDGSIGCEENPSGGAYYCIAVGTDGIVSDIVSFSYTYEIPAGRSAGLEVAATTIAAMTHTTPAATHDIKDGLIGATEAVGTEGEDGYVPGTPAVKDYIVSDVAGLNKLAEIVSGGDTLEGYTFTQTADIAFNENAILNSEFVATSVEGLTVFAGIGTKGKAFAGTYDGNGYKISHIYIYAEHSELGFICEANATTVVNNVILEDVYVTPSCADDNSDDRAGALIGCVKGDGATINNCVVIGAVGVSPVDKFCEHFGGLVGACDKTATANDCLVVARVTSTQGYGVVVASSKDKLTKNNVVAYDAAIE